ncbi:MAG: DNA-processing protein DprA [Acidimicrobiales bacterium]
MSVPPDVTDAPLPEADLPAEAWAVALSVLPGMGPARLSAVLAAWSPAVAWRRVAEGRATRLPAIAAACRPDAQGIGRAWARAAAGIDVGRCWAAHREAGVSVAVLGSREYPEALADDHEAPAVLFAIGNPAALDARRVAIVGTRNCTRYGTDVALELGRDLASAGVAVVSGLALGIDGAAHTGALAAVGGAAPVAVVGSGLDVVYPRRHGRLWAEVARRGLLLSEAPLGARPEPWRFPVRNRVLAALAEVVVVVESHSRGGSLHTVDAALARDRLVMAVPGSVRSPASALTNALLAEGCPPVRDAIDVLVALGLSTAGSLPSAEHRPPPGGDAGTVLAAVGWEPASLDDIVARSGLSVGAASVALARLEDDNWLAGRSGWWERLAPSAARAKP